MKKSDRYLKLVEWSEEDGCYVGSVPGLFFGGTHGPDEAKVYRKLCAIVDDVIESFERDGTALPPPTALTKGFSGKGIVRLDRKIVEEIEARARPSATGVHGFAERLLKTALKNDMPKAGRRTPQSVAKAVRRHFPARAATAAKRRTKKARARLVKLRSS